VKVVVLISASAECNAVKEIHPHLELRPSPCGASGKLQMVSGNWRSSIPAKAILPRPEWKSM
jgi:hypothetical protein